MKKSSKIQIYYRGNPNLKAAFVPVDFTSDQIDELQKCASDPIYFIRKYVKIISLDKGIIPFELWPFQENLIQTYLQERYVVAKFPRQVGKTQTTVGFLLWKLLFTDNYSIAVLAHKLSTAKEILKRLQISYERLPFWMQQGIKEWNKTTVELENGSRLIVSATSADTVRGFAYNCILLDEFGMVPNNIADDFMSSVFPTISSGKTTQLMILSTPKGMNHYYKLWEDAINGINGFKPLSVHWSDVPGRDAAWEDSQRRTLGYKFAQEHECEFLGSSNTLISSAALGQVVIKPPLFRNNEFSVWEEPIRPTPDQPNNLHSYVISVDTSRGVGKDYSAFSVIDITEFPYKQVATYRDNQISPSVFPQFIFDTALKYNEATVLVEINDIGQQVVDILHFELEYANIIRTSNMARLGGQIVSGGHRKNSKMGVKTTAQVKTIGCSLLKTLIENKKLEFYDEKTFNEFTTFAQYGKSYAAESGSHDDLVMTLVLFGWLTGQQYFKDLTDMSLRRKLYEDQKQFIDEELLPFGIIDDGLNQDEVSFVDEDNLRWFITEEQQEAFDFWDLNKEMVYDVKDRYNK